MSASISFSLLNKARDRGWEKLTPSPVWFGDPPNIDCWEIKLNTNRINPGRAAVRAVIINKSRNTLRLARIGWSHLFASRSRSCLLFPAALNPFYFGTENYRGDFFPAGTSVGDHYMKPLPNETVELGLSDDRIFPGVFIGSRIEPAGLLCAAASQDKFHMIFRLRGGNTPGRRGFEIDEFPLGIDYVRIRPGESVEGEKLFFGIEKTGDPQKATAGYNRCLELSGFFERSKKWNPLPRQRIWCSWNYDFFSDVTEDNCLKQIPVIKKHLPQVKFLQLDDGFQSLQGPDGKRLQIDFLYKNKTPFHPGKFPGGPEKYVRICKDNGIRPAIWLGLWANANGKMISENPGWVLLNCSGLPFIFNNRSYGKVAILDPSVPGVRRYFEFLCRKVFREWGFEGIKLDFSSTAFENKAVRFRRQEKTGAELRQWLTDAIRKHLPEDGFFGWCITAGTGTPLIAKGADYFRNAEDIGKGEWSKVKRIASWCVNTNMLMNGRFVLPNIDSVGWSGSFSEAEWMSWLSLSAITGYALEVSGDLTKLDARKLELLDKTLRLSEPLRKFWCPDVPCGRVESPPLIWVAGSGKRMLVCIFNWNDKPLDFDPRNECLKNIFSEKKFNDAYNGKKVNMEKSFNLPPHHSLLLKVR